MNGTPVDTNTGLEITYGILILLFVFLASAFSALETSITSINVIRFRKVIYGKYSKLAERRPKYLEKKMRAIDFFITHYSRTITTISICSNLFIVAASTLGALFFSDLIRGSASEADFVSLAVLTVTLVFVGEAGPKHFARNHPEIVCFRLLFMLKIGYFFCYPIVVAFSRIFQTKKTTTATEWELSEIVRKIREEGEIEEAEKNLILRAITFDDKDISQVYQPLKNIIFHYDGAGIKEILKSYNYYSYTLIPVIDRETKKSKGVINIKILFRNYIKYQNNTNVHKITDWVPNVLANSNVVTVLNELLSSRSNCAVVVDNYTSKKVIGYIFLNDIIELLVGKKLSTSSPVSLIKKVGYNRYLISASTNLEHFFKIFLNEETPETTAVTFGDWVKVLNKGKSLKILEKIFYKNYRISKSKNFKRETVYRLSKHYK